LSLKFLAFPVTS